MGNNDCSRGGEEPALEAMEAGGDASVNSRVRPSLLC